MFVIPKFILVGLPPLSTILKFNFFPFTLEVLKFTEKLEPLIFDSDAEFNIEGGSTESHYILKTLGLLGRVIKAELIF